MIGNNDASNWKLVLPVDCAVAVTGGGGVGAELDAAGEALADGAAGDCIDCSMGVGWPIFGLWDLSTISSAPIIRILKELL